MKKIVLYIIYLLMVEFPLFAESIDYLPDNFFEKDSVVILVTDSGLGGLSIAADLIERIEDSKIFKKVDIIFFNAQPHLKSGYNSMLNTEQKVEVFDNALNSMQDNYHPDVILIGCNTLSVLYEFTEFSKSVTIPVIGIVEAGVELIKKNLANSINSKVIIFGTETTVKQAKHKNLLIENGIDSSRIFLVQCPKLAGNIERDYESYLTDSLVAAYVEDAANILQDNSSELFVSYNCTHYGYIDDKFQTAFINLGKNISSYLNPNPYMNDSFINEAYLNRFEQSETFIKVVSQAELTPAKIGSIFELVEPISEKTANALFDYEFQPELFEWKSVINFIDE